MTAYANAHGVKVHGLGFTVSNVEEYGFYSTDSTSWNTISRFGSLFHFDGMKIKNVAPNGKRVKKSQYGAGEIHNIEEWIKYQNYLRRF